MPLLFWPLVMALVFVSETVFADRHNPLELYVVDYPPYIVVEPDGAISGRDVAVVKAAFKAVGIEVIYREVPWKRILKSLEHGTVAATPTCSARADRAHYILYSEKLSEAHQTALSVLKTPVQIQQLNDLKNYSVVAVEGWGIEKQLTELGIAHDTVTSPDDAIRQLINQRVEVYYSGQEATLFRAKQLGYGGLLKSTPLADVPTTDYFLCISKHYPEAQTLLTRFNTGLSLIEQNGTLREIQAQYDK